ncbi:37S ribosomal protein Rsm24 [Purpureocillium lavendulum]|uniref:37S ribosomal protein Rsm24 n=1 Tax=Purpureocillium lavendulum TaxID=1247861 RepID=A0AB34FMT9_9HYPO|nr:37S ribosomal protein Rsm24 [Purpureocillium lavendulum]
MKVFAIASAIMAASASVAFAAPFSESVAEKREQNLGGVPGGGLTGNNGMTDRLQNGLATLFNTGDVGLNVIPAVLQALVGGDPAKAMEIVGNAGKGLADGGRKTVTGEA